MSKTEINIYLEEAADGEARLLVEVSTDGIFQGRYHYRLVTDGVAGLTVETQAEPTTTVHFD